ncbi:expressed unknown protein [Seminavis robusta]|uniref:Uncharacterized protein n=1 Tax=Seminavis robusta TaxID=568900 RepID=A0A9N8DW53_9STRA|nr:expressed unknown protein [Seminavis robusta]|eukprot:Sro396_g134211.1  (174) ;mRNA; r:5923-6444
MVLQRHTEVRAEVGDLAAKAFIPSALHNEPRIHLSCAAAVDGSPSSDSPVVLTPSEERGDLLIRGLWQRGTDGIIDVRVINLDAASHCRKDPDKVLCNGERDKKSKYLDVCLSQRRHFSPFVVSADGLLGAEAEALAKRISAWLAASKVATPLLSGVWLPVALYQSPLHCPPS